MKKRKLISFEEAVKAKCQHTKPCSDCPFARDAIPGWLGGGTADDFIAYAHGEVIYDCHAFKGAQCAGMAIYRANVCKKPRQAMILPPDRKLVFAMPDEFRKHHE